MGGETGADGEVDPTTGITEIVETMAVKRDGSDVRIDSLNNLVRGDEVPLSKYGKMIYVASGVSNKGATFLRKSTDTAQPSIRMIVYDGAFLSIKNERLHSSRNPVLDAMYEPSDDIEFGAHSYTTLENQLE